MSFDPRVSTVSQRKSLLSTHGVLRNTYLLLSLTLLFSALCASFSAQQHVNPPGLVLSLVGCYGLMFLTHRLAHSVWGLVSVFGFTGFMGYMLGPLLNLVLSQNNGSEILFTALGGTSLIFFSLSAYVLTTQRDLTGMGKTLFVGTMVGLVMMIGLIFTQAPLLHLALSGFFIILSSGWILWETSMIIQGGQTNYILATIGLYVQLYNIFVSLLHLLMAFSNNRD